MKITFDLKGSIFGQKEPLVINVKGNTTIIEAMRALTNKYPNLASLLFNENLLRTDILIIADQIDVISMNMLNNLLKEDQQITILPLAHGG